MRASPVHIWHKWGQTLKDRWICLFRPGQFELLENRIALAATILGGASYSSIQSAVDNALPADVIEISEGIYTERVDVSRMGSAFGAPKSGNLTLRGMGLVTVSPVSGPPLRNNTPFTGNLTIDNLGFTSSTSTGFALNSYHGELKILNSRFNNNLNRRGVELSETTGSISIVNSEILNMGTKGIWLSNVENVLIEKVTIDGTATMNSKDEQDGVYGSNIHGIQILDSEIRYVGTEPADDGIELSNPRGQVVLADNRIHHVGDDAIQITTTDDSTATLTIMRNRIGDNSLGGGIEVRTSGLSTARTTALIAQNVLSRLSDHAFELSYKSGSQLSAILDSNEIEGILVESAMALAAFDTAVLSVDVTRNQIRTTSGHGVRGFADGASQLDLLFDENVFQNIGNEGSDVGIVLESTSSAAASLDALLLRNTIRTVSGPALLVRGLGRTDYHVTALANSFDDTNKISFNTAAVQIDKTSIADPTLIELQFKTNTVTKAQGVAAFRLNHVGAGAMSIVGNESTAQEVIEKNNQGQIVTVLGAVGVVQPPQKVTLVVTPALNLLSPGGGDTVTLSGSFESTASVEDLLAFVTWGDGTSSLHPVKKTSTGLNQFSAQHLYPTAGEFPVEVAVVDDAQSVAQATASASVTGWRVMSDGELQIFGTDQNDQVSIVNGRVAGTLDVKAQLAGKSISQTFSQISRIWIQLGAGDDEALIDDRVTTNAEIHGGPGKDKLTGGGGHDLILGGDDHDSLKGGSGDDILVGGAGDDKLHGGNGREVLIGGRGVDQIIGGSVLAEIAKWIVQVRSLTILPSDNVFGDLMIGGWSAHDNSPQALRHLAAAWASALPYEAKVQELTKPTGLLELGKLVGDDRAKDELIGNDWTRDLFFADQDRKNADDDTVRGSRGDKVLDLADLLAV